MGRARLLAAGALLVAVVALLIVATTGENPTEGFDVSFPQCPDALPSNPRFAVVGVNGGRANTANGCLAAELDWATGAPGQSRPAQPGLSFYINTGNPGDRVADWPRRGTAPAYGACNGRLTDACSYLYGEGRAEAAYRMVADHLPARAHAAPWWLDVELLTSWAATYSLNVAALQGFVAGLHLAGADGPVGIYSTAAQWREITGLTARTTAIAFGAAPPGWVAGVETTPARARRACRTGGFTGVAPTLAQYRVGAHDVDLRC